MDPLHQRPIETLRLSDRDKAKLIEAIDLKSNRPVQQEKRDIRLPLRNQEVFVRVKNGGGSTATHKVISRNISRRGFAFVHGQFIYPDTKCEVQLTTKAGEKKMISGKVLRCRHVSGIIHEVSIRFDAPVDLRPFIEMTPQQLEQHLQELSKDHAFVAERDSQKKAAATVLLVDDHQTELKLLTLWCNRLGLDACTAVDLKGAEELLKSTHVDLALVDLHLGEENGLDVMLKMKQIGSSAPVAVMTANSTEEAKGRIKKAGAKEMLVKPFTLDQLRDMVQRLTSLNLQEAPTQALVSTFAEDEEMRPLLREYVLEVEQASEQLRHANTHNDRKALEEVCSRLKGSGSSYGFEPITQATQLVLASLESAEEDCEELRRQVTSLVQLLRRVRVTEK